MEATDAATSPTIAMYVAYHCNVRRPYLLRYRGFPKKKEQLKDYDHHSTLRL